MQEAKNRKQLISSHCSASERWAERWRAPRGQMCFCRQTLAFCFRDIIYDVTNFHLRPAAGCRCPKAPQQTLPPFKSFQSLCTAWFQRGVGILGALGFPGYAQHPSFNVLQTEYLHGCLGLSISRG